MGKKPAKSTSIPQRRITRSVPKPRAENRPGPKRSGSTWPYVLLMICGWGVIFAGLFFSHFLSGLPDTRNLMISGPSMLLAWLKLRRRNLGPILDANGWAINGRARINVSFGAAMTELATIPRGSERSLYDPFADKSPPWRLYLFLIGLLITAGTWYIGRFDSYLPDSIRSTSVLGKHAPAYKPAAATPPSGAGVAPPAAAPAAAPAATPPAP